MIDPSAILNANILIVDDLEVNVTLLSRMLASAGYRCVTSTMDPRAVYALHGRHHYDLILLDLLMPEMDGFQVMEGLKELEPDGWLPVLVITAQPGHKLRALHAGARDFVSKPFDLAELLARVRNLLEARLLHKQLQQYNDVLEERVRKRTRALQDSYLETIFTMTRAAEHKDEELGAHVQRISAYSRALAELLGLDNDFVDTIFFASPMHDIGKIGIPDHILLKPAPLTPDEWEIMKRHTTMGAQILGNATSPYLKMGAEIALNHHERWDGGGYPHGLRGEAIPPAARVMNICDIYDALRSRRPYKPALDHRQSIDIITHGDGRTQPAHFDPAILATFLEHHARFRDIFEEYTA
ncbi:HD domain-containing phosphohydrolase [uncultured Thiodictyon sp.]|uniref:HD domain-containing phosphohydrolase n=1 Tax=uncultured Thiodictyon sp. TaxID=1846217 RepID=UPI0025D9BE3F|nr:HD domain-containing phosphohydrolase [uncultured Thiodictyon sp.]